MKRMPVMFIGHGSPMNAIEENEYVKEWKRLGQILPKPEAILSISAHWFTPNTRINDEQNPKTIYDMYGFPEELYRIVYPSKGAPELAHKTVEILGGGVIIDNSWGYDHGTWSVLHRIYPEGNIPVFQLSVNRVATMKEHYEMGQKLYQLREKGVLIMGSGNVVHNLARIHWDMDGGYAWANEFDNYIKKAILNRDDEKVIQYQEAGECSSYAFTTVEHYAPLLYALGAAKKNEKITVFNDSCVLGSLSMTSYLFEVM